MSTPYPITELFAWIVDDPSGEHAICAFKMGSDLVQAVSSKRVNMERVRSLVEDAALETGLPVRLQRFVLAETLETKEP